MNLPRFSVRNPVTANLLMWGVIVGGAFAGFNLRKEMFPTVEPEQITVIVAFPGATPEEVERLVARRIERAVEGIENVDEVVSQVFEGLLSTRISLEEGVDRSRALNDVRSAVEEVRPDLPESAEEPEVREARPILPVISIAVFGDVSEGKLREAARQVREDLLDATASSEIQISGIRDREIWVEISPDKLEEHGLTFEQVGRVLQRSNLDLPAGQLKSGSGNIRVRTLGESNRARDISALLVKGLPDGTALRLGDLGHVRETFEDRTERGRFAGKPAALVTVFKTPEEDAVEIAQAVKDYVKNNPSPFGAAIELQATRDLSRFIQQRLDLMVRNARLGLLLVAIALTLFLELRIACWVSIGLLVSFLGTFLAMSLLDATINLISMFGLIVVLGLLVDDAIVVGENTYRLKRKGLSGEEAAVQGANQVAGPVVAAVLTSMVAFLPLAFLDGRIGAFMGVLPVVVICALTVSLFEAFVVLPAHLSHKPKKPPGAWAKRIGDFREALFGRRMREAFGRLLGVALRWRYVTLAGAVAITMVAVGTVKGGHLPFVFLGTMDAETMLVELEMAPGSSEQETDAVLRRIEAVLHQQPEVDSAFTVLGTTFLDGRPLNVADPATVGQITIEMVAAELRNAKGQRTAKRLANDLRRETQDIAGVRRLSYVPRVGGPAGADIELRVRGKDLATVTAATNHLREKIGSYEGVTEVFDDIVEGKLELRYRLRDDARSLGLTTRDLALQIRHGLFGFEVQDLQGEDEEVTVRVLLPESERERIEDLGRLRIATSFGGRVPLEEVANLTTSRGYASLARVDSKRAFTIKAAVDDEVANVARITADLESEFEELGRKFRGVGFEFVGNKEETRKSMAGLKSGFTVAMFGIYFIVAILFRSYVLPVLVMIAIPISVVGVVFGHLLMSYPLTLLSMIGAVALAGIVVNDSLILIDLVNRKRREEGLRPYDAVMQGAKQRLRAILLTSITTCAGLGPLLLETSFQAQFLIPMAISIVFGLAFATGLVLIVVPTLYLVLDDIGRLLRWAWHGPAETA